MPQGQEETAVFYGKADEQDTRMPHSPNDSKRFSKRCQVLDNEGGWNRPGWGIGLVMAPRALLKTIAE